MGNKNAVYQIPAFDDPGKTIFPETIKDNGKVWNQRRSTCQKIILINMDFGISELLTKAIVNTRIQS